MKVVLSPKARDDLKDIARWIAADNPGRASTFAKELRSKCQGLSSNPERFPVVRSYAVGDLRKRSFRSYLIFYVILRDRIYIARIVHSARDWASIFADGA